MTTHDLNEELLRRREAVREGGGPEATGKQHGKGKLTARERIDRLLDPGSFEEVAPYITLVDLGAVAVASININLDTWKKLPAEVRDIIQEVGDEYSLVEPKMVEESIGACREKIKSMGGKFFTLPNAERAQWTAALPNQPNIKAKEADAKGLSGSAVMRAFIKYQKQEGYEFPREWKID